MVKILKPFYLETSNTELCKVALKALNIPLGAFRKQKRFMLIVRKDDPVYHRIIISQHLGDGWVLKFADATMSSITKIFTYVGILNNVNQEELLEKTKYVKLYDDVCKAAVLKYLQPEPTKEARPNISGPLYQIRLEPGISYQLGDTLTVRDNNKENQMKKGIKPRIGDRLVFTYTNGATYTVRGIVSAEFNRSSMTINYQTKKTGLDGSVSEEKVSRPVTNEISTVVFEHATGCKRTLLDLRPKTDKAKEVHQPTRNKRTREEWEALEAQRTQEAARQSRIAELQKELDSLSS